MRDGGAQRWSGVNSKSIWRSWGFRGIGRKGDAAREQGVDGGLVVTGFRQQFAAVLASAGRGGGWRWACRRSGPAAGVRRRPSVGWSCARMKPVAAVFVIQQVFDGVQAGRRDVGARQIGQPVVRGAVADDIGDEGVTSPMCAARAMAAKRGSSASSGWPIRAKVAPVLVVVDQQAQVAVGRGVGPAVRREQRRSRRGPAAGRTWRRPGGRPASCAPCPRTWESRPAARVRWRGHAARPTPARWRHAGRRRDPPASGARSAAPRRSAAHTAPRCRPVPGSGRRRRAARRRVPARRSHRRPGDDARIARRHRFIGQAQPAMAWGRML